MRKRKRSRAAAGDLVLDSVSVLGVKVDVKRRRGTPMLQLEATTDHEGEVQRVRRSAKTADVASAKESANALALELAKLVGVTIPSAAQFLVARGVNLTIAEVFDAYRELRLARLSHSAQVMMETAMLHFAFIWGADLRVADINQPLVDEFIATRLSGIEGPGLSPKSADGVRLSTARCQVIRLGTIFNFVGRLRHEGVPVMAANPLAGVRLPEEDPNMRRPVASPRRYALCLEYEPLLAAHLREHNPPSMHLIPGLYRLLLLLARETGRRIGAIRQLRYAQILRTESEVRNALAAAGGFHDEEWAMDWPAGAIHWVSETDKKRFARVTPISRRVRAELDAYMREYWSGDPDAYVFPHPLISGRCINNEMLWRWMNAIEDIIREHGHVLPKLPHGQYHPFRRLWRSERSGAFDPRLIALVGGWSVKTGVAMDDSYQWFSPTAAYLCAEFDPAVHRNASNAVPGVLMPGLAQEVLSPEHLNRELRAVRGLADTDDSG